MSGEYIPRSYWETSSRLPQKGQTVRSHGRRYQVLDGPFEGSADFPGFGRLHNDPQFILGTKERDPVKL
jgi:hypothetical protein